MRENSKEFIKTMYTILVVGLVVIGLIELQRMEYAHRGSEERLKIARWSGVVSVQNQAARLGYGRYQGETNFVWNTNLFDNVSLAMDTVLRSEQKTAMMADVCLRMAKATLDTTSTFKQIRENERKKDVDTSR